MVRKYLGFLLLAFGMGCGHTPYEVRLEDRPKKLEVRLGKGTIYNATRDEGEAALFELIHSATTEDAWVYVRKPDGRELWIDTGFNEKWGSVTFDHQEMVNYVGKGDIVIPYHIHLAPGFPCDTDYRTHARIKETLAKIGATSPKARIIMKGGSMPPFGRKVEDSLIEFEGVERGTTVTGHSTITPKNQVCFLNRNW